MARTRTRTADQLAYEQRAKDYIDNCPVDILRRIVREQSFIRAPSTGGISEEFYEEAVLKAIPGITDIFQPSHSGNESKSDRIFHFEGQRFRAQCKAPKTGGMRKHTDGSQTGFVSLGTTDKSAKVTPDGFRHETTWALKGEFDILVVPMWMFGCGDNMFAFKKAKDLISPRRQLPDNQSRHFLNIQQKLSFPFQQGDGWSLGNEGFVRLLREIIAERNSP